MTIRTGSQAFGALTPIMKRYGARCSPEAFVAAVDRAFHSSEAPVYDDVHRDMWARLPYQFDLLVQDALSVSGSVRARTLIDIGCGTGLAFDTFRQTSLGASVEEVLLLDTSESMLTLATRRAETWDGVEVSTHCGRLSDIVGRPTFDVAIACSVLHHVPDLPAFFHDLDRLLTPGGLFFHFQDQNGDANEETLTKRSRLIRRPLRARVRDVLEVIGLRQRLHGALWFLSQHQSARQEEAVTAQSYVRRANLTLLSQGTISRPMTAQDIWRVTDIHVGSGLGLSANDLRRYLPEFEPISLRSYGFFQELELPAALVEEEEQLISSRDMNGSLLAGVWQKRC